MGATAKASLWICIAAVSVAVLSAVVLGLGGRWEAAFRFVVVAAVMVLAWKAQVPLRFAAAFAVLILLAMWGSVQHWYRSPGEIDTLVHFLTPGSAAAVSYFLLVQARVVPDLRDRALSTRSWAPVVWVTVIGTAVATVWEYYEWVIEQINPAGMIVGYTDTIVDLIAGTVSSVVAGAFVVQWARQYRRGHARLRSGARAD